LTFYVKSLQTRSACMPRAEFAPESLPKRDIGTFLKAAFVMHVHILGSGAGGGFPQWNCNCDNCARFRRGEINARARTQSSIAISSNGVDWVLINASPDIRAQIDAFPAFQPARAHRDTAIRAVVLMDCQIDHTTGLLTLRENNSPLELYCTEMVHQDLTSSFPVLNMLEHYCGINWHTLPIDGSSFTIPAAETLAFTAVHLSSKAPPYSPHRHDPHPGDNVGLVVKDRETSGSLFYAPGLGKIEDHLKPFMADAGCLLVDGTCWTDDEMRRRGVGHKSATEMGHLYQFGPEGMIEVLSEFSKPRKVLIHINNTNPILDEDSPERAELNRQGIEVAFDGMDIEL
jgi:pyrroloquinoline quinone biosynthesis protein B